MRVLVCVSVVLNENIDGPVEGGGGLSGFSVILSAVVAVAAAAAGAARFAQRVGDWGEVIQPGHLHPWPNQDVARKEETAVDDSFQWKTFDHFC